MTEEAIPIEIGGETYFFRLEDGDVRSGSGGIEQYISLFVAFHPTNRTYDNAAVLLWKGLRKKNPDGKLVHAITQELAGREIAFQMLKKFCRQFPGITGMVIFYGYVEKALIANEWWPDPAKKEEKKEGSTPAPQDPAPKN